MAERQRRLDPGKLAVYDFALHEWIGAFGDGVTSMRSMSAVVGTLAIAILFVAVREVMRALGAASEAGQAELAAALAALIFALNLTVVNQARTIRMYPLVILIELAQVACFARAQISGRLPSLAGAAVFSALAVATNFTAGLLIAAEAVWLACATIARLVGRGGAVVDRLHLVRSGAALCAGLAMLAPFAGSAGGTAIGALDAGALAWARTRPPWWPIEMLRRASGKAPFLVFAPLALFAMWRMRRDGRAVLGFVVCWMVVPMAVAMGVTWMITPFEETRYVLAGLIAFFILAAAGLALIRNAGFRAGLVILIVVLSLDHLRRDFRKPQFPQWREATALAMEQVGSGGAVAVAPRYAINVVRYYLPPHRQMLAERAARTCDTHQSVLIMSGTTILTPARLKALEQCYPRILRRLRLVEIRGR